MNETSWRYEIKINCADMYLSLLRSWVQVHPAAFFSFYPPRQVNSLYFDNIEGEAFQDNLAGVSRRHKLRWRWYGDDLGLVRGSLELKTKVGRLGSKILLPIESSFDFRHLTWTEILRKLKQGVNGPFSFWLEQLSQPYLITSYRREYYETMDREVRLTLDSGVCVYEQLLQARPNVTCPVCSNEMVLEIKADRQWEARITEILATLPAVQVSRNSKYVNGVLHALSGL